MLNAASHPLYRGESKDLKLHWLPIMAHIQFKIGLLVCKSSNALNVAKCLKPVVSMLCWHTLRSASSNSLILQLPLDYLRMNFLLFCVGRPGGYINQAHHHHPVSDFNSEEMSASVIAIAGFYFSVERRAVVARSCSNSNVSADIWPAKHASYKRFQCMICKEIALEQRRTSRMFP